ncbi:hypothetical protein SDC9_210198 [bioreactor metagenome]|uniref:Uncharacterized protein n=1 Tax=bioreactor metagenome TaxID=1076179 RepID=A0A645JID1_9ZZZZ
MGPAFLGVDIIDKAEDILHIAAIVLQSNLNHRGIFCATEIDRLRMQHIFIFI